MSFLFWFAQALKYLNNNNMEKTILYRYVRSAMLPVCAFKIVPGVLRTKGRWPSAESQPP